MLGGGRGLRGKYYFSSSFLKHRRARSARKLVINIKIVVFLSRELDEI